jgi:hypothetical protein
MRASSSSTVTLKIPRPLYDRLRLLIEGTGFRSVTEFAIYVLRDLAAHPSAASKPEAETAAAISEAELREVRERLRELGYL